MKNKILLSTLALVFLLQVSSMRGMDFFYKYPLSFFTGTIQVMRESPAFLWHKANSIYFWRKTKTGFTELRENRREDSQLPETNNNSVPVNENPAKRSFMGYLWRKHGWNSDEETDDKVAKLRTELQQLIKKYGRESQEQHYKNKKELDKLKTTIEIGEATKEVAFVVMQFNIDSKIAEIAHAGEQTKTIILEKQKKDKDRLIKKFKSCDEGLQNLSDRFSEFYEITNKTFNQNAEDLQVLKHLPTKIASITKKLKAKETSETPPIAAEKEKIRQIYDDIRETSKFTAKQKDPLSGTIRVSWNNIEV